MKFFLMAFLVHAVSAFCWAKGNHHVVAKITDRYTQTREGKVILNQSTYLVGYFEQGDDGLAKGILTEAKTVDYGKAQLQNNPRRLDQVLEIANQMSGQNFGKSAKKLSEEICEKDGDAKTCHSAIELSL
ncbi:MAG: hypothetical protein ACK5Y2_09410 [Bdellovibrionales bacterium]